jgi:hypothetical protein
MAWEWVAPVAGAVVALTGLAVGTFTARTAKASAQQAAQIGADAQVRIAREERLERQLDRAYTVLLQYASQLGQWRYEVRKVVEKESVDIPDAPQPPAKEETEALVNLYVSDEVTRLWIACLERTGAVQGKLKGIEERRIPHPEDLERLLSDLGAAEDKLGAAVDELVDQMRSEIRLGAENLLVSKSAATGMRGEDEG